MRKLGTFLSILAATSIGFPSYAAERDPAVRRAFHKAHPCPSTGNKAGPCPGYVVDHIRPLCAGGPDRTSNMQWQTVAEAKKKDRLEAAECRVRRKAST